MTLRDPTKYERGAPDACWLWTGARCGLHGEYGQSSYQGRALPAHRAMWIATHAEPIPDGYEVCHSCDNPLCVNPAHLWLGTHQENMLDCSAKGRGYRVERRKLTDAQIAQIRSLAGALSQRAIAAMFGVTQPAVNQILRGITNANR